MTMSGGNFGSRLVSAETPGPSPTSTWPYCGLVGRIPSASSTQWRLPRKSSFCFGVEVFLLFRDLVF